MPALFAFLHHIAAFVVVAALFVEFMLLRPGLTHQNARLIQRADIAFGAAATLVLIAGVLRVMYFEKGAAYYMQSAAFFAKIALFGLVGLLSIFPTIEFLRWRKQTTAGLAPEVTPEKMRLLRMVIHVELLGVVLIILCAALMARGIWTIN